MLNKSDALKQRVYEIYNQIKMHILTHSNDDSLDTIAQMVDNFQVV